MVETCRGILQETQMTEFHLLFLLILKHCIADLGLQAQLLWGTSHNKRFYPWGGHAHYFHHSIPTFLIAYFFVGWETALLMAVTDHVAHWHIDFTKHRVNEMLGCSRKDKIWWWTATVDQLLHFLTYYLLVIYFI